MIENKPKLSDFGLAFEINDDLDPSDRALGRGNLMQ